MLSSAEFVEFILRGGEVRVAPTTSPAAAALPAGFEGFERDEAAGGGSRGSGRSGGSPPGAGSGEMGGTGGATFARRLLEAAGFGLAQLVERNSVIRSADPVAKYLPERASYWPKTPSRPYQTLLFEADLTHKDLLAIPTFRTRALSHLDIVEDALARIVSEALDGFQRGGEGVTAAVRKGRKDETLCIISIIDEREVKPVRLVCFGTQNKQTEGLETFQITEQTRLWDPQLAQEHLALLYERQFRKLGGADWQDAFTTTEERKQAQTLLEICGRKSPKEHDIQEGVLDLLDIIAKGFGLRKKPNTERRLQAFQLPSDHDIGIDPEERESSFAGKNPFGGVTLRDERSRLLGYIVYPLKTKRDAARLRKHLEENNRFHNVLVVYPDEDHASLELWQGREPLVGKLRKGQGYRDAADVVNLLSRFFVVSKARVHNPAELAQELAFRARYLHRLALRQLASETKHGSLRDLYAAFSDALLHDQSEEVFADAYAQTLTYGLLAARWMSKDDPKAMEARFTRQLAADYLPATSPFLREFFKSVLQAGFEVKLTWLLDDIAALLDRIDVDLVFSQALDLHHALSTDPIIHFYEPFLAAYDADQRRDRGVYYTPDAVVRYMVAQSDSALAEHAPGGHSLASGRVRVVDPATGTGTFLREIIRYVGNHGVSASHMGKVVESLRGLEIMVAPYAICHLRLALALATKKQGHTVRVHLADTLETPTEPSPSLFRESAALAREAVAAKQVKQERTWTLVIGNPPYKNNSDHTLAKIAERFPALLQSSRDAAAAQVRNIRDDYAWFFAAADSFTQGGGAICFVTSDSYLKKSSYRHLRRELLRRYRILRVTRLGNGVFLNVGPRIGFAIILMVRRPEPLATPEAGEAVRLVDISGLASTMPARDRGTPRDPRLVWLAAAAEEDARELKSDGVRRNEVRPCEANEYRLIGDAENGPAGGRPMRLQIVAAKGSSFEPIFLKKWPGVITAFDCLLKAKMADELSKRMKRFFDAAESARARDLGELAAECECVGEQRDRLEYLCNEARRKGLRFEKKRVTPVFAGSIPDGREWYPPLEYAHWIYYEPSIQVPRNVNPGKVVGWGTMNQWQEPEVHATFPKLIFTTSTNVRYGFRAYVIDSGWYTKLHGAASQQYNFVTLVNPLKAGRLGGEPNNLSARGEALRILMRAWGLRDEDLLHLVAAFYNSSYARAYILREEESMLPLPMIGSDDKSVVIELVRAARRLRELRAAEESGKSDQPFPELEAPGKHGAGAKLVRAISDERENIDRLVAGMVALEDEG